MAEDDSVERELASVPDLLYKFRRWRDREGIAYKYDQMILTNQSIWFASPADFNDPFDCKIPYRFHLMSAEEKYRRVSAFLRLVNPTWDLDKLRIETIKELSANPLYSDDSEIATGALCEYSAKIADYYGVLCLARNCSSIVMWSYYADNHRGYCVEIDAKALASRLFSLSFTSNEYVEHREVQYVYPLPIVVPSYDEEEDLKRHWSLLSTKSKAWQHEDESRFISAGRTRFEVELRPETLRRVIFGCQMPLEDRHEIAEIVRARFPNTQLLEAVRSNEQFTLDFRSWNPDGE